MINPVLLGVVLLCLLCLMRLNVLLALLISVYASGLTAGMSIGEISGLITSGFSRNGETALSYILLGTLASSMAYTGIADILGRKVAHAIRGKKMVMLLVFAGISCLSQNIIPVHIAFIPIMIPPLLLLMNELKLDRRAMACSLAFGLKAPYIAVPIGFGSIFQGIIVKNMTENGMEVTISDVASVNWILALAMLFGLMIAILVTYRPSRDYENLTLATQEEQFSDKLEKKHWVTIVALLVITLMQIMYGLEKWDTSLSLSAMVGLLILILGGAIKWRDIDAQFYGGVKIMGFIAFIMLVAGGFANVMQATGGVEDLVDAAVSLMGGSKLVAATMITGIGLLVTMGIGSSFSTIPVLAMIYVPLCARMGFSSSATILLIAAAAALGDAGSPASDTTLGPTSGLNADGQHNHIWDTCIPTFLHFNIPLMIAAILGSQIL